MHDLLFLLLYSIFLMPITELSGIAFLRVVLGLLYVAFLPGYALIAAVFPSCNDLDLPERLGLSFVLSISVVLFSGLLLTYSPWGIRLTSLLVLLGLLVLVACIIAYWRRRRLSADQRFVFHVRLWIPRWSRMSTLDGLFALALLLSVAASIGAMLYFAMTPGPSERFTEYYVLGPSREFDGYPRSVAVDESISVILGLVNHEQGDVEYRIEIDRDSYSEQVASIQLRDGETWEQSCTFALTEPGENRKVTFLLYKGDDLEPYRSLHLWITVMSQLN